MSNALIILAVSTLTLVLITGVFRVEDARGGSTIILTRFRVFMNTVLTVCIKKITNIETYLGKGMVRLVLHYCVHGILRRVLLFVSFIKNRIENLVSKNKQVAKEIRSNKKKTHLDKIAEHRKKTALTESQKKKMRSHE